MTARPESSYFQIVQSQLPSPCTLYKHISSAIESLGARFEFNPIKWSFRSILYRDNNYCAFSGQLFPGLKSPAPLPEEHTWVLAINYDFGCNEIFTAIVDFFTVFLYENNLLSTASPEHARAMELLNLMANASSQPHVKCTLQEIPANSAVPNSGRKFVLSDNDAKLKSRIKDRLFSKEQLIQSQFSLLNQLSDAFNSGFMNDLPLLCSVLLSITQDERFRTKIDEIATKLSVLFATPDMKQLLLSQKFSISAMKSRVLQHDLSIEHASVANFLYSLLAILPSPYFDYITKCYAIKIVKALSSVASVSKVLSSMGAEERLQQVVLTTRMKYTHQQMLCDTVEALGAIYSVQKRPSENRNRMIGPLHDLSKLHRDNDPEYSQLLLGLARCYEEASEATLRDPLGETTVSAFSGIDEDTSSCGYVCEFPDTPATSLASTIGFPSTPRSFHDGSPHPSPKTPTLSS